MNLDSLREWYNKYTQEITWFIIGVLSLDFINSVVVGNWGGAGLSALLIFLNYMLVHKPK
jgi:hypothetical protein